MNYPREVTKEEHEKFIASFPRPLTVDTKYFCTPPHRCWHDFTATADVIDSIVASVILEMHPDPTAYRIHDAKCP